MKKKLLCLFMFFLNFIVFAENYPFENNSYIFACYYLDTPNPGYRFQFTDNNFTIDIPQTDDKEIEKGNYISETLKDKYVIEQTEELLYLSTLEKKYQILFYED